MSKISFGSDRTTFIASVFLYFYESSLFLEQIKKLSRALVVLPPDFVLLIPYTAMRTANRILERLQNLFSKNSR